MPLSPSPSGIRLLSAVFASRRHRARLRDVRSGEPGAYARPCGLELPRAVIQSGAGPAVTSERWLTVKVAVPPPTRCMGRDAVAFHDPAKITWRRFLIS